MVVYFAEQRESVIGFFNRVRLGETQAVVRMLEVVMAAGPKGYFMSALNMDVKDENCQKLICHLHQPKMEVGFYELIGRNVENAVEVIKGLVSDLVAALKSERGKINYHDTVRLMTFCMQAIRSTQLQNRSGKDLVAEMLRKPQWLTEEEVGEEMILIREEVSAKLLMDVLGLHKFYKLSPDLLRSVTRIL